MRVEIAEPRTRYDPIDRAGNVAVLQGHAVRIETPGGELLEQRENARGGGSRR